PFEIDPPQTQAPIRRVPSSTSNKGCDVDDTAARTCPRVSPDTRKKAGDGYIRHPPRRDGGNRRCHRIGAGREPARDFSRTPNPTVQPGRSQPATSPPTSMRRRDLDATHPRCLTEITTTRP
uniref:Uncharacterized protein n=1 Tax=Triticum urartu TaxID=4572 RepID=A0A8R7R8I6_TRIUA